ncbi:hypothetical protein O7627_27335 [Solwaraspora sp. WMMD1047]|uniref:hypothetical protein n=1 Tax=Solwaraspora sp. WMMD1047 TaxID=3016102 RepID=UPI002415AF60|nr:hypothetical protein [Solwaraspora sp. WMMD1047]MDG4832990.1 hypothetical protein [Solwaraspora sp. WMMD1047]
MNDQQAASPLLLRRPLESDHLRLAVFMAITSNDPAVLHRLVQVNRPAVAAGIAHALDGREDLPTGVLAHLVAVHADLRASTSRLRTRLFGNDAGCHRVTRTVAFLEHRPAGVDLDFVASARFTNTIVKADGAVLAEILARTLAAEVIDEGRLPTLSRVLTARDALEVDEFARKAAAALARTERARRVQSVAAPLAGVRETLADSTRQLTRATDLLVGELRETAACGDDAEAAIARVAGVPAALPAAARPVMHHRHRQTGLVSARAGSDPDGFGALWETTWAAHATTPDGSTWDACQRPLVVAYHLLAANARTATGATPDRCWATDPAGRRLLHAVADRLTGYRHIQSLDRFSDDAVLRSFAQHLARQQGDRVASLHVTGFVAAVKAARSKSHLIDHAGRLRLGVVIPMRAEQARLRVPDDVHPGGQDAVRVKIEQLGWLLDSHPDALVEVLFVDDDPAGPTAREVADILAVLDPVPGLTVAVAARPDGSASAKGGAVLYGLGQLASHRYLLYTDLDLTYPLNQAGLLLHPLISGQADVVIGSRRLADSHGYYPPVGPNAAARRYQQAVTELLRLPMVTDPQAGFKAFSGDLLRRILPAVRDRQLSFDSELLLLARLAEATITEVGVCALHQYSDGYVGTPRDYPAMLERVRQQARDHEPDGA